MKGLRRSVDPHAPERVKTFESYFLDYSAVTRGGAGGARAPSVFFLKSKNRPV